MTDKVGFREKNLIDPPSADELQILTLIAQGFSNRQIAAELGIDMETVKWRARRLYTSLGVSGRRLAVERALAVGLLPGERALAIPEQNLPLFSEPFVGREYELADLRDFLVDDSRRLATLLGPEGVGKTRLAIQAASAILQDQPDVVRDGVMFVSLASLSDPAFIPTSLALALDFSPWEGRTSPVDQLARYLGDKKILFILDCFDSMAVEQSALLIQHLLDSAPGVQILATSRLWLQASSEQLFWLEGLSYPEENLEVASQVEVAKAEAYASIQLFVQAAGRLQPGFHLQPSNAADVARICQTLDGIPLAIEMAAVWAGLLGPKGILEALQGSQDVQANETSPGSEEYSSLRIAADMSWRMLTEIEQGGLQQLSIFPYGGCGFDRIAAAEICDVSLATLIGLTDKAWLQHDEEQRYHIPAGLRNFAAASLVENPGLEDGVRERHSQFYCASLEAHWGELRTDRRQEALGSIERDLENARQACLWSAENDHYDRLLKPLESLGLYYRLRGRYRAGEAYFNQITQTLDDSGVSGARELVDLQSLRALILKWRSVFRGLNGDLQVSDDLVGQAFSWLEAIQAEGQDVRSERAAIALLQGATRLFFVQEPAQANEYYSRSRELYQELGDGWGEGLALSGQARALRELGDLDRAQEIAERALDRHRESADPLSIAGSLSLLASIHILRGELNGVEAMLRESLEIENTPLSLTARSLAYLGWERYLRGELSHAAASLARGTLLHQELGAPRAALWTARQSVVELHLGRYSQALDLVEQAVQIARSRRIEREDRYNARRAWLQGAVELAHGDFQEAYDLLSSGLRRWKTSNSEHFFTPLAWLGIAARGMEKAGEARRRAKAEMKAALEAHALPGLLAGMAGMALWLADDGQIQRAVEIYAVLSRQSLFANSHWFQVVAGETLEAIALDMPGDEMETALSRGRQLDLWQAAQDLL